jgi:ribulose-phosphate 3-epimerase
LEDVLPFVDMVLVMTVNPGFGGQLMISQCLDKVSRLRKMRVDRGLDFLIEVDGGINVKTYQYAIEAGAEVLVLGSAFFGSEDPRVLVRQLKGMN